MSKFTKSHMYQRARALWPGYSAWRGALGKEGASLNVRTIWRDIDDIDSLLEDLEILYDEHLENCKQLV